MANSESEDFESADEEIMKPLEYRVQSPLKYRTDSSEREGISPPLSMSEESADLPSAASSNTPIVSNPDSLGAKPKMPLKSKSKSQSKHRSHKDSEDFGVQTINSPSTVDGVQKKRAGSGKLGVKITPSTILPSEIVALDRKEFQGKSKVSWSGNVSDAENKDSHDSIQPLLDKLSSLDVTDTPNKVSIPFLVKKPKRVTNIVCQLVHLALEDWMLMMTTFCFFCVFRPLILHLRSMQVVGVHGDNGV